MRSEKLPTFYQGPKMGCGVEAQRMSGWMTRFKANWQKIYFFLALGLGIFIYGVVVGSYDVFPHRILHDAKEAAEDWRSNYMHYSRIRPEKFIRPARQKGSGVTTYMHRKAYDGVTFVTSMWDKTNGLDLIGMDGSILHRWRVSLNEIFPKSVDPNLRSQLHDWDIMIHGARLYPNGDVVFNFEDGGLVKIDRCSKVIWKLPFDTHHSVYEDAEGNLWVPGRKTLTEPQKRLPLLNPPIHEDYVFKVSPEGRILEQISLLDVFYKSGQEALLFANGMALTQRSGHDMMHMNYVEPLEKRIAAKFPLFRAGDLLVSLRHLNLLVVIDGSTHKIKWSMTGPYIRQHDPHFLANGRISVYDNRADWADGKTLGGSRILNIDPVLRTVETAYQGDTQNHFFSNMQGEHQYLPNGNILITETEGGRVFEVTPAHEIVWTYLNRYDDDEVYQVAGALRYPAHYGKFTHGEKACQ
jgi:Arylsulfotransferase (ASST)